MSENFSDRLLEIMTRKVATERAAKEARAAKERAEVDRKAAKEVARALWESDRLPLVHRVVDEINLKMVAAGIAFAIADAKPNSAAISQLELKLLFDGGETGKRLVFNVNAFGAVQLVQLIPHTAPTKSSAIEALDERTIKTFIVDFLDIAIDKPKETAPPPDGGSLG